MGCKQPGVIRSLRCIRVSSPIEIWALCEAKPILNACGKTNHKAERDSPLQRGEVQHLSKRWRVSINRESRPPLKQRRVKVSCCGRSSILAPHFLSILWAHNPIPNSSIWKVHICTTFIVVFRVYSPGLRVQREAGE